MLDRQLQLAVDNVQRLLFHFVVLEAQRLPLVHMEDLADVTVGVGKDQLVSPRFRDVSDRAVLEEQLSFVGHRGWFTSPSGNRMATLSMTNSSISCAVFFCRAISAMRRQSL